MQRGSQHQHHHYHYYRIFYHYQTIIVIVVFVDSVIIITIVIDMYATIIDLSCFLFRAAAFIHLKSLFAARFKLCKLSFV